MPRGGRHEADAFSPYKAADGRELTLLKSSKSATGYLNVTKIGKHYWVKVKLDAETNSKKQKVFGKATTARGAAIELAEYRAAPRDLPSAPPRAPRTSKKADQERAMQLFERGKELQKQAMMLLGEETVEEQQQRERFDAEAAQEFEQYCVWKNSRIEDGPVLYAYRTVEPCEKRRAHESVTEETLARAAAIVRGASQGDKP